MKSRSYFLFVLYCIFITSCKKSVQHEPVISKDIVLPQNAAPVVAANNKFAFDFFRTASQTDNTSRNKLLSPLSIYLALCMVYNGADNATRDSIHEALRLANFNIDDLNETCRALIEQIPSADNKISISIANSVWYRQTMQPLPNFLQVTNDYYHTDITPLNFDDPSAINTINKWVSDKTEQKITKILEQIDPNEIMFLLNAIYFKGSWKYRFDKTATSNNLFYLADNSTVSTDFMMLDKVELNYFKNDTVQVLQLPYGGGNFNMYVLLPEKEITITDFVPRINPASFQNWQAQLKATRFRLYLPKFKYSYTIEDMKPALAKMGMGIAFSDFADFSKMYNIPTQITRATHKTYIDVNEEGTEAAAITSVGIGITSIGTGDPLILNIDHPFVYIIQEKSSGSILFTGMVNNPALQQ